MLHRAHLGLGQMDPGLGRVAEPGVVGQVDQHVGLVLTHALAHEARDDVLVADGGREAVRAELQRLEARAGREAPGVRRPLVELGKGLAERDVLAEHQQDVLVVAAGDVALLVGQHGGVEQLGLPALGRGVLDRAVQHRADDRGHAEPRGERAAHQLVHVLLGEGAGHRGFAPHHQLRALVLELARELEVRAQRVLSAEQRAVALHQANLDRLAALDLGVDRRDAPLPIERSHDRHHGACHEQTAIHARAEHQHAEQLGHRQVGGHQH